MILSLFALKHLSTALSRIHFSFFQAYDTVDEASVYLTAGAALPSVIESVFQTLLNDNFQTAYENVLKVKFLNFLHHHSPTVYEGVIQCAKNHLISALFINFMPFFHIDRLLLNLATLFRTSSPI